MENRLIYFILFFSIGFSSWIQNPSPLLIRPFDAQSTALAGINSFEEYDMNYVKFSYSYSDETIFAAPPPISTVTLGVPDILPITLTASST